MPQPLGADPISSSEHIVILFCNRITGFLFTSQVYNQDGNHCVLFQKLREQTLRQFSDERFYNIKNLLSIASSNKGNSEITESDINDIFIEITESDLNEIFTNIDAISRTMVSIWYPDSIDLQVIPIGEFDKKIEDVTKVLFQAYKEFIKW